MDGLICLLFIHIAPLFHFFLDMSRHLSSSSLFHHFRPLASYLHNGGDIQCGNY
jgi:hypothetical protein